MSVATRNHTRDHQSFPFTVSGSCTGLTDEHDGEL